MSDYQKRTPERLIAILRSWDQNPRSWQQEAADEIASLRAQLAIAGEHIAEMTDQLASARKALEHAQVRFKCVADDANERGDEAGWAMASVDADRMTAALTDETGK